MSAENDQSSREWPGTDPCTYAVVLTKDQLWGSVIIAPLLDTRCPNADSSHVATSGVPFETSSFLNVTVIPEEASFHETE